MLSSIMTFLGTILGAVIIWCMVNDSKKSDPRKIINRVCDTCKNSFELPDWKLYSSRADIINCNSCFDKRQEDRRIKRESSWQLGYANRGRNGNAQFTIWTMDEGIEQHFIERYMFNDEPSSIRIVTGYNNCELQDLKNLFKSYLNAVALGDKKLADTLESLAPKVADTERFKKYSEPAKKLLERLEHAEE